MDLAGIEKVIAFIGAIIVFVFALIGLRGERIARHLIELRQERRRHVGRPEQRQPQIDLEARDAGDARARHENRDGRA